QRVEALEADDAARCGAEEAHHPRCAASDDDPTVAPRHIGQDAQRLPAVGAQRHRYRCDSAAEAAVQVLEPSDAVPRWTGEREQRARPRRVIGAGHYRVVLGNRMVYSSVKPRLTSISATIEATTAALTELATPPGPPRVFSPFSQAMTATITPNTA